MRDIDVSCICREILMYMYMPRDIVVMYMPRDIDLHVYAERY